MHFHILKQPLYILYKLQISGIKPYTTNQKSNIKYQISKIKNQKLQISGIKPYTTFYDNTQILPVCQ